MDQPEKPARKPRKPKTEGVPETPPVEEPKKPRARRTPAKQPTRARKTPSAETPAVSPAAPPVTGNAPVEAAPVVKAEPPLAPAAASTPPVAKTPVTESVINTAPMPAPRPVPNALPVPHEEPDLFKPLSAAPPATPVPMPTPPKRATLTMPNAQQISAAASQGQKLARQNGLHLMADLRQVLLRIIAAARSAGSWLDRGLVGLARPYGGIKKSVQENVQHWEESIQKSDSVVIISTLVLVVCLLAIIGLIVSAFQ